ncbi:MAG: glycosyltransferase [Candidatus Binatia bacterium]
MEPQPAPSGETPPIVSVVMPTYNRRATIRESLDSVLNQSFRDFEVIVVDDGSTDGTEEELRPYRNRILYLYQENRGGAGAHNTGIRHAQGQYVAFMDSDDLATPHHLLHMTDFLERYPQYTMAVGNGAYLEGEYHNRRTIIPTRKAKKLERGVGLRDVYDGRLVRMQGTMIRRGPLLELGLLDDWFRISWDLDLALRVLKNHRIGFVNEVVYLYRKQGSHVGGDDERRSRENLRALQKLFADYPEGVDLIGKRAFSRLCAYRYCRLARALAKKGEMEGARDAMRQAVTLHPFSLKYRLFQYRWA